MKLGAPDDEWLGLWGFQDEAGLGDEAVDEVAAVLHALESGLHQGGELLRTVGCEVAHPSLQVRPHALGRVELGSVGG